MTETHLTELNHWINGVSVPPTTGQYIETLSPMTGGPALRVAAGNAYDVSRAAQAAELQQPKCKFEPNFSMHLIERRHR